MLPESRTRETTDEIFARYKIFKERIERDLTYAPASLCVCNCAPVVVSGGGRPLAAHPCVRAPFCILREHESQRESMLGEKDKRVAEFWNDKYEYLLFERERVKTYLAILRDALGATLAGLTNEET